MPVSECVCRYVPMWEECARFYARVCSSVPFHVVLCVCVCVCVRVYV